MEKLLEAVLVLHARRPRKTHDLDLLVDEVLAVQPELAGFVDPFRSLTPWAYAYRYPLDETTLTPEPSVADILSVLSHLQGVRGSIVSLIERAA